LDWTATEDKAKRSGAADADERLEAQESVLVISLPIGFRHGVVQ
jgi:hypothetical protein